MKTLVTGGAGFIGSHVVDELVRRDAEVIVYDDLSTGFRRHLTPALESGRVELTVGDILDEVALTKAMEGCSTVFHLAANADVRGGPENTRIDLDRNIIGTYTVLESMKRVGADTIVFTSSAAVYGEPDLFPTPESYAPLQTSVYGASKLAAEAYTQAYAEYFGMRALTFRFVSWIGERYSHGVVFDFMNKLRNNPAELEILGDGNQTKSYLHVEDGVRGIFLALDRITERKSVINLGHEEFVTVAHVADMICDEVGLSGVSYRYTGGERGWVGDSPVVHLDISKIKSVGFRPRVSIEEGVRRTVRYLTRNRWLLDSRGGAR